MASIPPLPTEALKAAYLATNFEVTAAQLAVFRVGQQTHEVSEWLLSNQAKTACIITAWNPFSVAAEEAVNLARQGDLIRVIEAQHLRWLPAQGRDPQGMWPPEPSLCVLDVGLATVDQLLVDFDQMTAVVLSGDSGCRLRWHPAVSAPP